MDEDRRSFLKTVGCAALGLGCGFPLLGAGCTDPRRAAESAASTSTQWAMVVDVQKCLQEDVHRACT